MKDSMNELNLDNFEFNSINKVWLKIITNSLHRPISTPVIIIKGAKKGPVFGITAALHGNEVNGIGVIHKFLEKINTKNLHGTIVCVLVSNIPGYLRKTRGINDRFDLNHLMPGKKNGNTAEVYAYNLFHKIVKKFDFLVDLHTASKGRQNTLYIRADMSDKKIYKMATLIRPEIILHNPPNDKTLRGIAAKNGIQSVTVEVGNPSRFQDKYIRKTVLGLKALLANAGILKTNIAIPKDQKIFRCKSSKWFYTDDGGILDVTVDLGELIKKGDTIAVLKDIFGDEIKVYKSNLDGIIIGKSIDPIAATGSRIIHLGILDGK